MNNQPVFRLITLTTVCILSLIARTYAEQIQMQSRTMSVPKEEGQKEEGMGMPMMNMTPEQKQRHEEIMTECQKKLSENGMSMGINMGEMGIGMMMQDPEHMERRHAIMREHQNKMMEMMTPDQRKEHHKMMMKHHQKMMEYHQKMMNNANESTPTPTDRTSDMTQATK